MSTFAYTYDKNGNRITDSVGNARYPSGGFTGITYNRSHTIPDDSNRLTFVSGTPSVTIDPLLGYDLIGNVVALTRNDGVSTNLLSLNYNDPIFPILPTNIDKDGTDYDFAYDHNGARIKRQVGGSLATTSYFVPSGTENLAELDGFGRVARAYLFAGGERIGYKAKNRSAIYVKDHLGSTKMTLRLHRPVQNAFLVEAWDTDPYGIDQRNVDNTSLEERHGFTGQEPEDDLFLTYYGARFYMPEIGRFIQVDPAREFANPYSYVGNNPVAFVDSTGNAVDDMVFGDFSPPPRAADINTLVKLALKNPQVLGKYGEWFAQKKFVDFVPGNIKGSQIRVLIKNGIAFATTEKGNLAFRIPDLVNFVESGGFIDEIVEVKNVAELTEKNVDQIGDFAKIANRVTVLIRDGVGSNKTTIRPQVMDRLGKIANVAIEKGIPSIDSALGRTFLRQFVRLGKSGLRILSAIPDVIYVHGIMNPNTQYGPRPAGDEPKTDEI